MKPSKPTPNPAEKASGQVREHPGKDAPQGPVDVPEIGGREGPDPTRYGDWEKDVRCVDF